MRIAHVVTLASPNGEFGGPLTVAENLAWSQLEAGHSVVIFALATNSSFGHARSSGVEYRLSTPMAKIPGMGFSGVFSIRFLLDFWRSVRDFDVVHVHLARDLVTLPAATICRARGVRYVCQTHGMVDKSNKMLARLFDPPLTIPALSAAHRVFFLTNTEKYRLTELAGKNRTLRMERLVNGVPPSSGLSEVTTNRIVSFIGRIAPRKNAIAVARAALALHSAFPEWQFVIAGPDGGSLTEIVQLVHECSAEEYVLLPGALTRDGVTDLLSRSAISVLASYNEPYPMSVLEAMSFGIPVVISDSCGLAKEIENRTCGVVTNGSQEGLEKALFALMGDAFLRQTYGERGACAVRDDHDQRCIATALTTDYLS